ncbi:MAG: hypothetical protein Q8O19_05070, partial [Rectinemataceae bacterium]|nr:hypothetical protein [Rectinemataceae bacterium]
MPKNIFTILISIIVLGAVISWGAYVLRGQKQTSISSPTSTPQGTTTSATPPETIGWQTYQSEKYKYKFVF